MRPSLLRALTAAVAFSVLTAGAASGRTYRPGDEVVFSGQVRDTAGAPLGEVTVLLEVSRQAFSLGRRGRKKVATLQVPTTTNARGNYRIVWHWDRYYDTFELAVALGVRRDGRDTYHVFHRIDLTGNVLLGSPVVFPLVVEDTTDLERLRAFFASLKSEDEKRIYQEMGLPERIDVAEADYDPDRSWWYFKVGKVYRFRAGRLEKITHFDPVEE